MVTLQWPHCLLSPSRDQHCPVLTVYLAKQSIKMTYDNCLQNRIIVNA